VTGFSSDHARSPDHRGPRTAPLLRSLGWDHGDHPIAYTTKCRAAVSGLDRRTGIQRGWRFARRRGSQRRHRHLAAGGPGGVTIFDLGGQSLVNTISASGRVPIANVPSVAKAGISAAFNADGSLLAWPVGVAERKIVVWDFAANKERARLDGDGVYAFTDDGRALALESFDDSKTATVADIKTGTLRTERADYWRHRAKGSYFPPKDHPWYADNGQGLGASIAFDGTLTLWDTANRLPIGTVGIPGAWDASYLIFDNAGRRLAVATSGGALSIVDVYLPSWINRACNLTGRQLDAAEWRRYVGDRTQTPVCGSQAR